jgi:hypothetical protein
MVTSSLWRHADFMKLWAGLTVSELGSVMTRTAVPGAVPAAGRGSALGCTPARGMTVHVDLRVTSGANHGTWGPDVTRVQTCPGSATETAQA